MLLVRANIMLLVRANIMVLVFNNDIGIGIGKNRLWSCRLATVDRTTLQIGHTFP